MSFPGNRISELEAQIGELRSTLDALEAELKSEREDAQHRAIDQLEEYIHAVDTRFESFQTFWKALLEDLRSDKSHPSS